YFFGAAMTLILRELRASTEPGALHLLIAALILRARDNARQAVSVTIVEDLDAQPVVLWSVGDHTYSRPLTAPEANEGNELLATTGYVFSRYPDRLALQRRSPPAQRACMAVALAGIIVAVVGFLVSLIPIVW
ncbi:hypothetical protein CJ226_17630, partial [Microbacterium sp. UMB0228]|uniref:hypothetical protein n=1 Tax=Microbacterium sp. UMB0228 TaxID=2029109 RepID=UPI000CB87248